jgi:hypothetical protein
MKWNVSELGYTSNQEVLQADCHHVNELGHERKTFLSKNGDYLMTTRKREKQRALARADHDRWLKYFDQSQ